MLLRFLYFVFQLKKIRKNLRVRETADPLQSRSFPDVQKMERDDCPKKKYKFKNVNVTVVGDLIIDGYEEVELPPDAQDSGTQRHSQPNDPNLDDRS